MDSRIMDVLKDRVLELGPDAGGGALTRISS